tara:strand:- start:5 stop:145 length:141 start_codon:yes stop_codon:yes gene_type:complete
MDRLVGFLLPLAEFVTYTDSILELLNRFNPNVTGVRINIQNVITGG